MSFRYQTAAFPASASARRAFHSSSDHPLHYVSRTFKASRGSSPPRRQAQAQRQFGAGVNKRIVLIDDSIVRGTTSVKIVQMMRDAGAREVHMRIASPPTTHSCFCNVDTPERAKYCGANER